MESTAITRPENSFSNQMEMPGNYIDQQAVFNVMKDMKEEMRLMREEIADLRTLIQNQNSNQK